MWQIDLFWAVWLCSGWQMLTYPVSFLFIVLCVSPFNWRKSWQRTKEIYMIYWKMDRTLSNLFKQLRQESWFGVSCTLNLWVLCLWADWFWLLPVGLCRTVPLEVRPDSCSLFTEHSSKLLVTSCYTDEFYIQTYLGFVHWLHYSNDHQSLCYFLLLFIDFK